METPQAQNPPQPQPSPPKENSNPPPQEEHETKEVEPVKIIGPEPPKKRELQLPKIRPKILIILFITLAVFLVGGTLFKKMLTRPHSAPETETAQETTASSGEQPELSPFTTYIDDDYNFSFTYKRDLTFEKLGIFTDGPIQYRVIYAGTNQNVPVRTEEDLIDGYIFKVYVHKDITDPILDLIDKKMDRYKLECSDKVELSKIEEFTFNPGNYAAYTFQIDNCPPDYKHTFIVKNNYVFEIVQVHRGDLGFRQAYKTQTEQILDSFMFTDTPLYTGPQTEKFESREYGFSLRHKQLNSVCCNIAGPALPKVGVLARKDPEIKKYTEPFDGIGIFADKNPEGLDFETYLRNQKQELVKEYQTVVGQSPVTSENVVNVGSVEGVLLQGYAWWGDVILVHHPQSNIVFMIAKVEESEGSFNGDFGEILSSFEFFVPEAPRN